MFALKGDPPLPGLFTYKKPSFYTNGVQNRGTTAIFEITKISV
jgi:hypothetical protein